MAVTHVGEYRNIFHVFTKILEREGFLALYRGFSPTMIGIIPYAGVSFSTFEMLMRQWTEKAQKEGLEHPTHLQRLISGGVAGLIGQASAYPLDIVRRRMQTASQMGIESSKYSSITGTLRTILKYVFKVSLNFTDSIILSISGKKVFGKAGTKATA